MSGVDVSPGRASRVQLVCMPFQSFAVSPLSVALLATVLREQGIAVEEAYLHFEFGRLIGRDAYTALSLSGGLAGELFFAEGYHGFRDDPRIEQRLRPLFGPPEEREAKRAAFLRYCLGRIGEEGADLVGLSTTFNQLSPSLWLAKKIKEVWPATRVVLGGTACSQPMGEQISRHYREVDHVVSGPGERALLELARGGPAAGQRVIAGSPPNALDALPIPDYQAFLREAGTSSADPGGPMLTFESSRGCWWGEKNPCSFCGVNADTLAFSAKSSARVVREIRTLWERHGKALFATDSILSRAHLKEVMPALAACESKPAIFYEAKVNMSREDLALLWRANVRWLQPGIESLSTALLRRLNKGVKAIQNLAFLKGCREVGIAVSWNLLCGIPGERVEDYQAQIELMKSCPHLMPPHSAVPLRIDRYSPYFKEPGRFGLAGLEPFAEYRLLHPTLSEGELRGVAYHFNAVGGGCEVDGYFDDLERAVKGWQAAHARGDGLFWDDEGGLLRVQGGEAEVIAGDGRLPAIIAATHDIATVTDLCAATGCDPALLDELLGWGILYREGNQVVNLAVRTGGGRPA